MTERHGLFDGATRWGLTLLLLALAAYGAFSTPGLLRDAGVSLPGIGLLMMWLLAAGWALSTTIRAPARAEWFAFGAFAIAGRIGSAMLAAPRVSDGDSHWYIVIAQGLLHGDGLVMHEPYMGIATRALFPPLYPLLLAGWGAVAGFSTVSVLVLSSLIDLVAAAAIIRLAVLLGERRAGVAAACVYLILPSVLLSAPLAQKEGLEIVFVLLLAIGWITAIRTPRRVRDAVAIGLPAAALALTQPGDAMLAMLFGIVLSPTIGLRRMLAIGIPAAIVAALAMLPWWVRNWLVFGAFVPLTTASGYSLWIGNNPDATGNWMAPPPHLRGLPELAYGKAAAAIATEWIVHHPFDFIRLTIAKFLHACGIGRFGVDRLAWMTPPLPTAIVATLLPVSQGAYLIMLTASSVALRIRRDPAIATLAALLLACVAQLVLFAVWFEFGERHRESLGPFLLLTIAVAVPHIVRRRSI